MRTSTEADYVEDLFSTIRELLDIGVSARSIHRYVNQSLRGTPPSLIAERVPPFTPGLSPTRPPEIAPGADVQPPGDTEYRE